MEVLGLLEKKLPELAKLVSDLREENRQLREKIDSLETAILKDKDRLKEETEITGMVVEGLLKTIDEMVGGEHQQ